MIITFIECYKGKVIRTELQEIIQDENVEDKEWECSFFDNLKNVLIQKYIETFVSDEYVSDIQNHFDDMFFEEHKEYRRKTK